MMMGTIGLIDNRDDIDYRDDDGDNYAHRYSKLSSYIIIIYLFVVEMMMNHNNYMYVIELN